MKTQRSGILNKKFFSGILLIAVLVLFASCASNEAFLNSTIVPGATGKVKVKKDSNQNYVIDLEVKDLASVERLQSSKQMYMVWMETENGNFENLGQLNSSTSFMSKQRKASLKTVSSFKPVRFFITTEDDKDVRYPAQEVILTTEKFN